MQAVQGGSNNSMHIPSLSRSQASQPAARLPHLLSSLHVPAPAPLTAESHSVLLLKVGLGTPASNHNGTPSSVTATGLCMAWFL